MKGATMADSRKCICIARHSSLIPLLSVCPGLMIFLYFHFYVLTVVLLKDMGESFLLSEDELLTPNIDWVVALWIFRNRSQNTKIGQKSAKIGPLKSSFYLVSPPPPCPLCTGVSFSRTTEPSALGKKLLRYTGEHGKGMNLIPPIWYRPFPHTYPLCCTLGQGFNLVCLS